MGKGETRGMSDTKNIKSASKQQQVKLYRKTVLGSNTLALFLTPSSSNGQLTPVTSSSAHGISGNFEESCSPHALFNFLKDANKFMVKGTKLHESLKELRLCGWVSPLTLLLTGPAEDVKVLKHAWIKRYLKNPLGYYIKDCGVVQEFIVELLPQSPFLSLKTALFDAVVDLNNQNIFPTKENLREYLKKHYPDVKLPEIRHVHECLGRLVKERRLYHNGCGYFILCNVNVLNELKIINNEIPDIQYQSSVDSTVIKGFALSSSSSSAPTELDSISTPTINTSTSVAAETSSLECAGFPSFLESNQSNINPVRSFFRKHVKQKKYQNEMIKSQTYENEMIKSQAYDECVGLLDINVLQSDGIEKSDTSYVYSNFDKVESVRNSLNDEKVVTNTFERKEKESVDINKNLRPNIDINYKNEDEIQNDLSILKSKNKDNESSNDNSRNFMCKDISPRRSKLNRSHSFDSRFSKVHNDVTFAIVGIPFHYQNEKNCLSNEFKRSHSFGAGSSKKCRKPQDTILKPAFKPGEIKCQNSGKSRDLNSEFNKKIIKANDGSSDLDENLLPLQNDSSDLLFNYEGLGSSISFHKNTHTHFTVTDLSSPPVSSSLAGELNDANHGQYI